jgi:hypothetical protein
MKQVNTASFAAEIKSIEAYLATTQKNKLTTFINNSFRLLFVIVCYCIGVGLLFFPFILQHVFPFHILGRIEHTEAVITAIGSKPDVQAFAFSLRAVLFLMGIVIIAIATVLQKNMAIAKQVQQANLLLIANKKAMQSVLDNQQNEKIVLDNGAVLTPMLANELKMENKE